MLRSIVLAGGIVAFSALGASAASLADRFTSFFVFGDSLSDNGNLFAATGGATPLSPPYFNGRFSNGPVWNEGILDDFAVKGNFAFGGATAVTNGDPIPDLAAQVGGFVSSALPAIDGNRPLASLWFGANDILNAVEAALGDSGTLAAAVAAANAVGAGVKTLATAGIKDFAVWNLPDIGATPRFALLQPGKAKLASDATSAFNTQLDLVLADLRKAGLHVTEIDAFGLFGDVLKNPKKFGLMDAKTPCLIPGASFCGDAAGRLFFDPIHPTAAAHGVLAKTFIAAVPLPSTGLLLAFGIGLLALRRRAA